MEIENSFVMTGKFLGTLNEFKPSNGTYVKNNNIFAAIPGIFNISTSKNQNGVLEKIVEIKPKSQKQTRALKLGSEIIGRVVKIKEDYVTVRILCIENEPINAFMQGVIRKANIRLSEIDKIKIEQCFLPGDIVKARVLSYGDSHKIYLSTMENDLGVMFARSQNTDSMLLPFNWSEMISVETGVKEMRKVAMPDFSYFGEKIN